MNLKHKIIIILLIAMTLLVSISNCSIYAFSQEKFILSTNNLTKDNDLISLAKQTISSGGKIMKYDARTNETTEVNMDELRSKISKRNNINSNSTLILNSYNPNQNSSVTSSIQPFATGMEIVQDTSIYPNISVCKIFCIEGELGTAALVGPNTAITAAHCVFDQKNNNEIIKNWTIYAGYDSDNYYGTPCGWDQVYYSSNWKETHSWKDDWAICVLQSDLGDQVGYFGVEAQTNPTDLMNKSVYALGYPSDESFGVFGEYQYSTYGQINLISGYSFRFNGWTTHGFSGGPVVDNDEYKSDNLIVGVVTAKKENDNDPYCAAITPEMAEIVANHR